MSNLEGNAKQENLDTLDIRSFNFAIIFFAESRSLLAFSSSFSS